jgi:hypothetical protein
MRVVQASATELHAATTASAAEEWSKDHAEDARGREALVRYATEPMTTWVQDSHKPNQPAITHTEPRLSTRGYRTFVGVHDIEKHQQRSSWATS